MSTPNEFLRREDKRQAKEADMMTILRSGEIAGTSKPGFFDKPESEEQKKL